jgi:transposase InsO family protein
VVGGAAPLPASAWDIDEAGATAFTHTPSAAKATAALPFRLTHVLTDNASCFTPRFARVCAGLGAAYRHTRPRSPQTNGMVERFNGRVGSGVRGIAITPTLSRSVASMQPTMPDASAKARLIAEAAKEVSRPDNESGFGTRSARAS